jgi:hypothetical protein
LPIFICDKREKQEDPPLNTGPASISPLLLFVLSFQKLSYQIATMRAINEWLAGSRDYEEGVALYLRFGKDKAFINMFREERTPFKEKKLVELLKGLLAEYNRLNKKEEKNNEQIKEHASGHGWPAVMDTELLALWSEWKPKYSEFMNLTHRLYDVAMLGKEDKLKEMEAGAMAHKILDLRDEIKEIYAARDYYIEHGCFPVKTETFSPVVGNDAMLGLRRQNVRRYLTRLYNILKKPAPEDNKIRMKQIKKFNELKQEMIWINKKLNRPENEGIPGKNK